jgi:hypothetical protein
VVGKLAVILILSSATLAVAACGGYGAADTPRTAGGSGTPPAAGSVALGRVEQTFTTTLRNHCERPQAPTCDPQGLLTLGMTTPEDVPTVDVVVTATVTFRVSSGDSALARTGYRDTAEPWLPIPCCDPFGQYHTLAPPYPLAEAGKRATSTTISWAKQALPANGAEYSFAFSLKGLDTGRDGYFTVIGRNVTVVVEMWSTGD